MNLGRKISFVYSSITIGLVLLAGASPKAMLFQN